MQMHSNHQHYSPTIPCFYLQILDSQGFEEFQPNPLHPQDSSLISPSQGQLALSELDSLGQHLELELGLGTGAGVISGARPVVSSALRLDLGTRATVESQSRLGLSLGTGLELRSGVCMKVGAGAAAVTGASSLDPEAQRRLSLQEPQVEPLDSRTPQRHSSDPGGS